MPTVTKPTEIKPSDIIHLSAGTRAYVHMILLTSFNKQYTQSIRVDFNCTPELAYASAVRQILLEYPNYQIAAVSALTFEGAMPKR